MGPRRPLAGFAAAAALLLSAGACAAGGARTATEPASPAVATAPAAHGDTAAALLRAARRAEAHFERLARQRAPLTLAGFGGRCDEIVGRFCLRYESSGLPEPEPEPPEVLHARRAAIEALRRAFAWAPGEAVVAGPLVRYLVEDERPAEAVSAARAFLALSHDSIFGSMLIGFALHAAGENTEAERWFSEALQHIGERERQHVLDVRWLLSGSEARHYNRLDPLARRAYEAAFWQLSNPLYLTPGNERQAEHIARHVWSRIMAGAPVVTDMVRWGRDLEQLTVRYGMPTSRVRARGHRPGESSMIERFDPDQLAYAIEDMVRSGVPPQPLPGEQWPLDNPRARSAFAPVTVRRIAPLDHQVSLFPTGSRYTLRVDAMAVLDSTAAAADSVRAGLFVLDSLYQRTHADVHIVPVRGDTVRVHFMAQLMPGRWVYSVELYEPVSRYAARARYALVAEPVRELALSDVVIAEPTGEMPLPAARDDARLRPHARLELARDVTAGVFAEVSGLAAGPGGMAYYRVEVSLRTADRASLPGEVVRWLGRRVGLGSGRAEPVVSWTAEGVPDAVNVIAVDVHTGGASPGLHVLEVAVTDLVTGARVVSRRPVRVR